MRVFQCGRYSLSLAKPLVMGIVNVTPDSFSDGGRYHSVERAVAHAQALVDAGADILDVGGESTRPGAAPVSVEEELARVIPVVEQLASLNIPVSVDTRKPEVMAAAIAAGASMINDVTGFSDPKAQAIVAEAEVGVCVMHMQGTPETMQKNPHYHDVVAEVSDYLANQAEILKTAGVEAHRIAIDPGFGFGKTLTHNLQLLRGIKQLCELGYPVLIGVSRKSMIGQITGRTVMERTVGSVVAALLAVQQGAHILRVHDVAQTRDMLAVWHAYHDSLECHES